jgi:hypothetical protein
MELIVCTPKNLIDIIRKEDPYDEDRVHPLTDLNFLILDEVNSHYISMNFLFCSPVTTLLYLG